MSKYLVLGGEGRIGRAIAHYLRNFPDTEDVAILDLKDNKNLNQHTEWQPEYDCVVSALPASYNLDASRHAAEVGTPFIDLGGVEEIVTAQKSIKSETPIIPNCGLAPGLVPTIAYEMVRCNGGKAGEVLMACGGITVDPSPPLGWTPSWSLEGLVSEYSKDVTVLRRGLPRQKKALTGTENIKIFHRMYEMARTSGGAGSLPELLKNKAYRLDYKTIRYLGHYDRIKVLLELCDAESIKNIIAQNIKEEPDCIIFKVMVDDLEANGHYECKGDGFTAMQDATAIPTAVIARMAASGKIEAKGFYPVETLPFYEFRLLMEKMGLSFSFSFKHSEIKT